MKPLKFWLTLIAEITVALALFTALSYWQERDMLQSDTSVPSLSAMSLEGKRYQIPQKSIGINNLASPNKKTLLYFFAPWCSVCHISIGNLNILRGQISEEELSIIIVALDWQSVDEVEQFISEHELDFPVLLGDSTWQQQYKVKGFPSYYVINGKGEVLSKSMGYSSSIGMLRRTLFN